MNFPTIVLALCFLILGLFLIKKLKPINIDMKAFLISQPCYQMSVSLHLTLGAHGLLLTYNTSVS